MAFSDAVGRSSPDFSMDVERGKIREFARATGAVDAAYLDAERPVMPPTFLVTQSYWQTEDAEPWVLSGLDTWRGLHAEQEYVFHGPPPKAGTRLSFQTRITEMDTKKRRHDGATMIFVVAVTTFRDEHARIVAEARATAVEIHPAQDGAA